MGRVRPLPLAVPRKYAYAYSGPIRSAGRTFKYRPRNDNRLEKISFISSCKLSGMSANLLMLCPQYWTLALRVRYWRGMS